VATGVPGEGHEDVVDAELVAQRGRFDEALQVLLVLGRARWADGSNPPG